MPPKNKFTKQQFIDAAFEIAKKEGFDKITLRGLAGHFGCSVAPIYVNFTDIEDLKNHVVGKAISLYEEMISAQKTENDVSDIEIASVLFAKENPLLFEETVLKRNPRYVATIEKRKNIALQQIKKSPMLENVEENDIKFLLFKKKAFQEGLALLATNPAYADIFTEKTIIALLKSASKDFMRNVKQQTRDDT
ncbi:MAG: TetR/AcrR family transcriptional regulator [Spirochaetales bacterium]